MNQVPPGQNPENNDRAAFDRLLGESRAKLHRYCARMTGSVIDGEDVVQDTIIKALEAFPSAGSVVNIEGWLLRIAHNAALRARRRRKSSAALWAMRSSQPSILTTLPADGNASSALMMVS